MLKNGLVTAVGVALGLGATVALAAPDGAVLGWTGRAPSLDGTAPTSTPTATPRNHGELVAGVARTKDEPAEVISTSTSTPTPTATVDPSVSPTTTPTVTATETSTATPVATGTPTGTATPNDSTTARNHGQYVSDVAHSAPPGPEHGKLVSAAARSDVGKGRGESDVDLDDDLDSDETPTIIGSPTATPTDAVEKTDKGAKGKKAGRP